MGVKEQAGSATKPVYLLVIEDSESDFLLLEHHLRRQGLAAYCFRAVSAKEIGDALEAATWDAVLSDFNVPGVDFHDSLALLRERRPELPVILLAGSINEEVAVELLTGEVADFILKNNLLRLVPAIRRAIREAAERSARQAAEAALRQSQAKLQAIFDNLSEGVITASLQGELLYWNRAALDLHGYASLEECQGARAGFDGFFEHASLAGEALPLDQWPLARVLQGETLRDLELRITRLDQGWRRVYSYNGSLARDPDGKPLLALLSVRDVSERKVQEAAQRWAALLFANIQEGALVTDGDGGILAINPAFTAITGYGEAEILGQNLRHLLSVRHDPAFHQQMWQAILGAGGWQGEIRDRRKNGEMFLAHVTINAVHDTRGEVSHYVGTFTDITRLEYAHQMEYLAHHDALTGLPNRLQLLSRLEHALEISKRHRSAGALLFLDFDGFKAVNDTWGHPAGDELLQQAARRLAGRLRDMDTLARLGGDEFVAVLEDIDRPESAAMVARELIQLLNQPFPLVGGQEARIGGSVGIALFPLDSDSAESLLHHADMALYRAKRAGRNTYRFHGE